MPPCAWTLISIISMWSSRLSGRAGSDWPAFTLAATYEQVMEIAVRYVESYPEEDKQAVLGENAVELYELEAGTNAG